MLACLTFNEILPRISHNCLQRRVGCITAIGLERVRIAREVNLRARDIPRIRISSSYRSVWYMFRSAELCVTHSGRVFESCKKSCLSQGVLAGLREYLRMTLEGH